VFQSGRIHEVYPRKVTHGEIIEIKDAGKSDYEASRIGDREVSECSSSVACSVQAVSGLGDPALKGVRVTWILEPYLHGINELNVRFGLHIYPRSAIYLTEFYDSVFRPASASCPAQALWSRRILVST